MSLQPRRPPGHGKRKALIHAADINRLRVEGHSLSAIRDALEDAGVVVSISTVRREVLMGQSVKGTLKPAAAPASTHVRLSTRKSASSPIVAVDPNSEATSLPGKDVAAEFMQGRPTNPLFLKESSK